MEGLYVDIWNILFSMCQNSLCNLLNNGGRGLLPLWIANQNRYWLITRRKTANSQNTNISGDAVSSSVSSHKNLFYKSLKAIQLANSSGESKDRQPFSHLPVSNALREDALQIDTGKRYRSQRSWTEFKFPHLTSLFFWCRFLLWKHKSSIWFALSVDNTNVEKLESGIVIGII